MRNPEPGGFQRLRGPVLGIVGGALVAMGALELAILTDDFSIEYVANNSASTTPFLFKIASGWAALEGSILLWALVLAGFVYSVYRQAAKRSDADGLGLGALFVLGIVSLFFFGVMLTVSNPFRVCIDPAVVGCFEAANLPWSGALAAAEGRGPNPLLQNHILMAVHPPMLYLGYVGMVVPFAFAMSALLRGESGSTWLKRTRVWTLVAWGFLTVGIVLGGLWSYEVLGWGGYWAWDPVENASFIPWLTATAFLHSSVVQERRGMLQAWNFVLIIATFALTILGTFLTRSGVIVSVHSFTQSAIGPVLLWFLMLVLVASFGLFAARIHLVASSPRLDSMASREGVFLFNNLLLTVFAVMVTVGTLYPMFTEAVTGDQVGVGRPFFDRMAIPLSFGLLLAMGLGPITPYRAAKGSVVWQRIRMPLQVALAATALAVVLGYRNRFLLIGTLLAVFVMGTIVRNLWTSARKAAGGWEISIPRAALRVMRNDTGYWGGQISHFGIALLALGIAISANLSVEAEVVLVPGGTATVAGYDLTYVEAFSREEPHRFVVGAEIEISRNGRVLGTEEPRLNRYGTSQQSIATPSVDESLTGDLYLSLKSINPERITLGVWWFPFIWLIWVGGLMAGAAVLWSRLVRKPKPLKERVPVSQGADDGG
ncbi:MAG: heme lyase CcmF/NrfE family subunit [Acidimicrobiia bacterium]|nr:heme lyase CcmF/NrfE family subunit [Acidimicrobiia bacterium]MBT8214759.1 heme lyase CcmF/NrfE family subunit [Acidimicrobiia bacterium]NNF68562.1 heme lyase CcmF/NrfE family subunit [Acidimicrobiia bacterium]NNK91249.1 heme lyase CcmF/NrfE family subunit [Acidimicrobiia bacterium]